MILKDFLMFERTVSHFLGYLRLPRGITNFVFKESLPPPDPSSSGSLSQKAQEPEDPHLQAPHMKLRHPREDPGTIYERGILQVEG